MIVFFSSKNNLYLFWLKVGFCVVCALFVLHNLIIIYLMVIFSSDNAKVLVFPKYTPKSIKTFLTWLNKFSKIKETFNELLAIYIKFSIVFFVVFIIFFLKSIYLINMWKAVKVKLKIFFIGFKTTFYLN